MKKALTLLLFVCIAGYAFSQIDITIGSGTATSREIPVMTIRAYTYTQQIYLKSEINRAGTITKIRFYMVGNIPLTNSNKWTIYLGHVGQSSFSSTTDWIPVSVLTQVFSGYVSSTPPEGWYEIVLTTPFVYNGTQNLVVAIDENQSGSSSNFGYYARVWTPTITSRGIWTSSGTNPNPASPPEDTKLMDIVNQIQFEMLIPDGNANPTNLDAVSTDGSKIRLTWTENTSRDIVMVAYNKTNRFGVPVNGYDYQIGDTLTGGGNIVWFSGTESFTHEGLDDDTDYFYKIWSKASYGGFSSGVEINCRTICANISPEWHQNFNAPNGYTFPVCWTRAIGLLADSVEFETNSTDYAHEWWNANFAFESGNYTKVPVLELQGSPGNGYTRSWLMSPAIDLGESKTMYLQFDKAFTLYTQNASCNPNGIDDKFAVLVSTNRGASWLSKNIIRLWDNNENTESSVLNDISHVRSTETIPLTGYSNVIKFAFYGESTVSNADNSIFIDNVLVTPCPKPTDFTCSDTTTTSAVINWQYDGPSNCTFEIYYDFESEIISPNENTTPTISDISVTGLTVSNLSSGSKYIFYLRASNSYGDKSLWTGPISIETLPGTATLPFSEGFESATHGWLAVNDFSNKWYVSDLVSHSGNSSAFISMDPRLYIYTNSASYAYIYKDIEFPESVNPFTMTFYWKCGGNYNDYLNVYIIPTSIVPNYSLDHFSPYRVGFIYYYSSNDWTKETISLPAESYSNNTYRIVFGWKNSNSNTSTPPAAIDDIEIFADISTEQNEYANKDFTYFVENKTLTIKNSESVNSIKIFNALGANIFSDTRVNSTTNDFKINLLDGIYIISVEYENKLINKKILIK